MSDDQNRMYYIRFWNDLFGNVLGWTADDVINWAQKWRGFDDPASMFYHESPAYYATAVFTRRAIESLGATFVEANRIDERLRRALVSIENDRATGKAVDWKMLSERIQGIVAGSDK